MISSILYELTWLSRRVRNYFGVRWRVIKNIRLYTEAVRRQREYEIDWERRQIENDQYIEEMWYKTQQQLNWKRAQEARLEALRQQEKKDGL